MGECGIESVDIGDLLHWAFHLGSWEICIDGAKTLGFESTWGLDAGYYYAIRGRVSRLG